MSLSEFKPGDKVKLKPIEKCKQNANVLQNLELDKIYTVERYVDYGSNDGPEILTEAGSWYAFRFELASPLPKNFIKERTGESYVWNTKASS